MGRRFAVNVDALLSPSSYGRGIGRYVSGLIASLLETDGVNEYVFFASGEARTAAPAQAIEDLHALLGDAELHVFAVHHGLDEPARETFREHSIRRLCPDAVLETSPFENLLGYPPLSGAMQPIPVAAILYDLIPYALSDAYLPDATAMNGYLPHLTSLHRAEAILCISDWTAQDAINLAGLPSSRVRTISSGLDPNFVVGQAADQTLALNSLGVDRDFILYVGGDDFRKNIEGLIAAYALLRTDLRQNHQLVVACSLSDATRRRLLSEVRRLRLEESDVILTGRVDDDQLRSLYARTSLFVFPSLYEGFGLPILEAMAHGAPAIGADSTSVAEVLGIPSAQFDASDPSSIADRIAVALTDPDLRTDLLEVGRRQVERYTWPTVAHRVVHALEGLAENRKPAHVIRSRPRLAFVTPMPPERSGVATFAATALPHLSRHYEIVIVNDDADPSTSRLHGFPRTSYSSALESANRFDRVLYQIGNSEFHRRMPDLAHAVPGVVEFHDLFLGGLHSTRSMGVAQKEFDYSHGRSAGLLASTELHRAIARYPASARLVDEALGIIVHSQATADAVRSWYGAIDGLFVVPMNLLPGRLPSREAARIRLGIPDGEMLVASFGILHPSKMSLEIIEAWQGLSGNECRPRLVLVGQPLFDEEIDFETRISRAKERGANVTMTGFADESTYRTFLAACDLAVQLRTGTRGETSGAYLDALVAGKAVLTNDNPAFEPRRTVGPLLGPNPTPPQIHQALQDLLGDGDTREAMAEDARRLSEALLDPSQLANQRRDAIEWAYSANNVDNPMVLSREIVRRSNATDEAIASALTDAFPRRTLRRAVEGQCDA